MRFVTWLLLVGLSIAAVLSGHFGVAVVIAGTKTLLVGAQYMELRWAHRAHAAAFASAVLALVLVLRFLAGTQVSARRVGRSSERIGSPRAESRGPFVSSPQALSTCDARDAVTRCPPARDERGARALANVTRARQWR